MAVLPISYIAPMVRSLLADLKTQTRRNIEPYEAALHPFRGSKLAPKNLIKIRLPARLGGFVAGPTFNPRYAIGDRLYVREHWRADSQLDAIKPSDMSQYEPVYYEADKRVRVLSCHMIKPGRLRQGMHMPRWASRLTLIVTNVRVERLQDISESDAIAEGLSRAAGCLGWWGGTEEPSPGFVPYPLAKTAYAALWNHINGAGAWEANPWVVAYTFEVIKANIDQIGGVK